MSPQEAERIIRAYALATAHAPSGVVLDVRGLPFPKERIKQALLLALSLTPPGVECEKLKSGFLALASWQDFGKGDARSAMLSEGAVLLEEVRARDRRTVELTTEELDLLRRLRSLSRSDRDDVYKLIELRERINVH